MLEVLLVVAIIAILAGIVIIAINPAKQLGDTRNTQRSADVTSILNATWQYMLDTNGNLPPAGSRGGQTIGTTATEICSQTASSCTSLVDLATLTTNGKYLAAIPKDPNCNVSCNANGTGYTIFRDANNHITVASLNGENKTITVTR